MKRKDLADYQHFHSAAIYGTGGKHFPYVLPHILSIKADSLIDYGAGRSEIAVWIAKKAGMKRVARFDPAVPGIDKIPEEKFDIVTSFDVLEHIPEEELDDVLREMSSVGKHALFVIDIAPAKAILSDGRNAHVCLHEEAWWQQRLIQFFPDIRPLLLGVCFLREAPERAIGSDRRAGKWGLTYESEGIIFKTRAGDYLMHE